MKYFMGSGNNIEGFMTRLEEIKDEIQHATRIVSGMPEENTPDWYKREVWLIEKLEKAENALEYYSHKADSRIARQVLKELKE